MSDGPGGRVLSKFLYHRPIVKSVMQHLNITKNIQLCGTLTRNRCDLATLSHFCDHHLLNYGNFSMHLKLVWIRISYLARKAKFIKQ